MPSTFPLGLRSGPSNRNSRRSINIHQTMPFPHSTLLIHQSDKPADDNADHERHGWQRATLNQSQHRLRHKGRTDAQPGSALHGVFVRQDLLQPRLVQHICAPQHTTRLEQASASVLFMSNTEVMFCFWYVHELTPPFCVAHPPRPLVASSRAARPPLLAPLAAVLLPQPPPPVDMECRGAGTLESIYRSARA